METAVTSGDSAYSGAFPSGTSASAGIVSGVIANMLMECIDTNYHVPCEPDHIKERLIDYTQQVNDPVKCGDNFDCPALLYQCNRPAYC